MEIIILSFDTADQLLTIKYSALVRYMVENVVGYDVYNTINLHICLCTCCHSHWLHCIRRGSAAVRLLTLWFPVLLGAWISVMSVVSLGRGTAMSPCTVNSYLLWHV